MQDDKLTEEDFKDALVAMAESFDKELREKNKDELEEYWFFKWEETRSIDSNIYNFYDLLKIYAGQCRRWEEHHNGCCCVVERVRDTYIMPKIKEFRKELEAHILAESSDG